ncbi:MAG: glycosyltransferase family 9 protein [Winogradskyella sp.]|uniref:glycosyltransferase family 9 protein n=1 Tax=Winogradskyella sp. TaxID=1883156 RepID=UPI0017DA6414|nr:glycosyltransferase family 9 protein [Winogradskyella sp.]MBT8243816.1 glycosyltransferase family 9 protein [Winogradskyella sp.]NNK23424.1 glycosyltransferase family 9 protein [Winogradskyella sp.]
MGDVAMSVPVIRALTEQFQDLKVTVVTREFFKPFFRDIKNVSVYQVDLKGKHKGILGLYKLSKELKALNFTAAADIHNVLRTKILKLFIGGNFKQIDKGRAEKKALVSGHFFEQLKTTHQRYADVFEQLGFSINLSNPKFPKKVELNQKLKHFVTNVELPIVGVAPFAAFEGKMYPLDKMKQVIESLSGQYNIILFGGGKQEIEQLNHLENSYDNTKSVAGKLSLEEELDLISNLNVMLSMDSGNAHMAAMLGIKVITIWGVTHPFAGFAPYNQPEDFALLADRKQYPEIPTSIYGNKQPVGYEDAAGSVSTETIINKIKSILN